MSSTIDNMTKETRAFREEQYDGELIAKGFGGDVAPDDEDRLAERHDYEPGDAASPMRTDPDCRICGEAKRSATHR